jgi:hypothetical protein
LKKRRKIAERLPDNERVGCFVVSLVPLKTAVDEQLERFGVSLTDHLRSSAATELQGVEEWLTTAMERLSSRPDTIAAMTEAKVHWQQLAEQKCDQRRLMTAAAKKAQMLEQTGGGGSSR